MGLVVNIFVKSELSDQNYAWEVYHAMSMAGWTVGPKWGDERLKEIY